MYTRYSRKQIEIALSDTPVVFIMGSRQCGKTTLVKSMIDESWVYITLDDQSFLESARFDPLGFIRNLPPKRIVIDEVQRVPELFLAIKQSVDENRTPGRFILTGSANALLLPRLSDSLAGRMETIHLNPLAEIEILGKKPFFFQNLLSEEPFSIPSKNSLNTREHLLDRLITGCFPEVLQRSDEQRRLMWYHQYIQTLIQRDIQDIANIEHPKLMDKLFKTVCFYSGKLINYTEIGNEIGLTNLTTKKYLSLLEQLFLIDPLSSWHTNEHKRLIKAPKMHVVDTGMIVAARGLNKDKIIRNPKEFGILLESFVYNELKKQASWVESPLNFSHYRDKDKVEVDIIIENNSGDYFAIEVKAAASISEHDFKGLRLFQAIAKERFKKGILLYDGYSILPFGKDLYAVPIYCLWS